ncbi:MAG: medium chain dehydrogenase/reductase family protein [Myxococcaceae bacterium]
MKALVIPRYGLSSVLEVRELEAPQPKAGELRISVRAAGLNFSEVSARQGLYPDAPKNPAVVGYEVAGVVDALGEGVTGFARGDRVWALTRFGGHAEQVCTGAGLARKMPAGCSFETAAALPVAYATAQLLVAGYGTVRPGERVLVHMAAGGVGLAAIDLLRRVPGVTIFGTASASKHELLRARGVAHPIDYRSLDFEAEVMRLTNGKGVQVVLDPMGGRNWKKNFRVLAPLGRLMVFGLANATRAGTRSLLLAASQVLQAPRWSPMTLMDNNRGVMGLNMGHLFDETELIANGLDELQRLFDAGEIKPEVDQVFPFSRAPEAHERIERRENVGKIILVPDVIPLPQQGEGAQRAGGASHRSPLLLGGAR